MGVLTRGAAAAVAVAWVLASGSAFAQADRIDYQKAEALAAKGPATLETSSHPVQAAQDAYDVSSLRHRAAVFDWQLVSTKVIFWMVVALVFSGVAFSAIQFGVALRRRTDFNDAEIAMSMEGVKVRSQFLGVITLALSLGFFYLYLKTVYPIVELPEPSNAVAASAPAKR